MKLLIVIMRMMIMQKRIVTFKSSDEREVNFEFQMTLTIIRQSRMYGEAKLPLFPCS